MKSISIVLIAAFLFLFTGITMNKSDSDRINKLNEDIVKGTKVLDSLLLEGIMLEMKIDSLAYVLQKREIEIILKTDEKLRR